MEPGLFSSQNPVFSGYAFYSSILIFKMMLMSALTGFTRHRKKAFVNAEDATMANTVVKNDDEDVERVRRAHLNDVENIPIFLVAGLLFVASDPNVVFALMMFRIYTVARLAHTVVYAIFVVKQPARGIAFMIAHTVTLVLVISMLIRAPFHYSTAIHKRILQYRMIQSQVPPHFMFEHQEEEYVYQK